MIDLETKSHAAAWTPKSLSDDWKVVFTPAEAEQIIDIARMLASENRPTDDIEDHLFKGQSGTLHQTLLDAANEIGDGRGFVLLRGFPLDALNEREAAYGYAAVGRYLGRIVAQNPKGDVIGKVMNQSKDWK